MDKVQDTKTEKIEEAKDVKQVVEVKPAARPLPAWFPWVLGGLAALVIAMLAYSAGYQMSRGGLTGRGEVGMGMMRGSNFDDHTGGTGLRGRGMMNGTVGEVTAISTDSITIKDTMRGGTVTYKIDSSTKVTENSTTKAVSDIKTGNTVQVAATGSDTTIATEIRLGTY